MGGSGVVLRVRKYGIMQLGPALFRSLPACLLTPLCTSPTSAVVRHLSLLYLLRASHFVLPRCQQGGPIPTRQARCIGVNDAAMTARKCS